MPTTNTTNSSMNTITNDTNAGIAPASNGSSSRTRIRTVILAAGTPLCVQPSDGGTYSVADGSFSIGEGGAFVTARVTIDDGGTLDIRNAAGKAVLSVGGGLGEWTKTKDPTTWHGSGSAFRNE